MLSRNLTKFKYGRYVQLYDHERQSKIFPEYQDIVQLVTVLNLTDDTDFINQFPNIIDVNQYLRELVVEVATGNDRKGERRGEKQERRKRGMRESDRSGIPASKEKKNIDIISLLLIP